MIHIAGASARSTGWTVVSGSKYYFNLDGVMQTGFQTIKGSKYYFNDKGVMETGWKTIEKNKYYISETGIIHRQAGKPSKERSIILIIWVP